MSTLAPSPVRTPPLSRPQGSGGRASVDARATLVRSAPLLALGLGVLTFRMTYLGGGTDDWHYLFAARCWSEAGACLAQNHWGTRWALIAPMALAIRLFGDTLFATTLVPLAYTAGAVLLLAELVRRWRGPAAGAVAGCALALAPSVLIEALRPSVGAPELFWFLAGLSILWWARRADSAWIAALAGVAFAAACGSRLTAVALMPFAPLILLPLRGRAWPLLLACAAGGGATVLLEWSLYWWATGNPFHGVELSLAHTRIPSTNLARWVPLDASPLLNPDYIAGWERRMGIHLHWTVDGLLNLLVDPEHLTVFASALILGGLAVRERCAVPGRALWALAAAAAAHIALLIYVLAIDPTPRMTFPLVAVAAVAIGVLAPPLWRTAARPILLALVAIQGYVGLEVALGRLGAQPTAEAVKAFMGPLDGWTISDWVQRTYTFDPDLANLPVAAEAAASSVWTAHRTFVTAVSPTYWPADRSSDATRVLTVYIEPCAEQRPDGRWVLRRRGVLPPMRDVDPVRLALARLGVPVFRHKGWHACEFVRAAAPAPRA